MVAPSLYIALLTYHNNALCGHKDEHIYSKYTSSDNRGYEFVQGRDRTDYHLTQGTGSAYDVVQV